jgi:hypothetical protein
MKMMIFFLLLSLLSLAAAAAVESASEGKLLCNKCQAEVEKLDLKWTNATSVQVILDQLKVLTHSLTYSLTHSLIHSLNYSLT